MSPWPHFSKAPITEALLDIRASLPPSIDLPRLAVFQDAIRDRYPERIERMQGTLALQMKDGALEEVSKSTSTNGYLFKTADGRQIVQARLDGFTFHRLKPYDRWETLRDEAKAHWRHYMEIATPESVTRIALRYINVLELPLPVTNFKDYILTVPDVAPSLPQELRTFFLRLEIPDDRRHALVIITETIQAPTGDGKTLPFVFDIDAIRETSFQAGGAEMWDAFEQLRDLKNEAFFNSLTYKARELFR
jgi:uncharacterized protein (TIGR04255 family)